MHRIVVGVDGSQESIGAFRIAVREADRRGAELTAVLAYAADLGPVGLGTTTIPVGPHAERRADTALREAADAARAGEDVELIATPGKPAETLLRHAKGADMLVVGSRGRGGFTGLLLGSVSHQVVTHATVPVLVVPLGADTESTSEQVQQAAR